MPAAKLRPVRPSTTTRSSSPQSSSDKASSGFFRAQSVHSSSSSFVEEQMPPVPKVAHYILPPSELHRWDHDEDARPPLVRPARALSMPVEAMDDARPSLPLPPRRAQTARSPASPEIPLFSTAEPINHFGRRSTSTSSRHDERPPLRIVPPASQPFPHSEFGLESAASSVASSSSALPPPPRPARSARRPRTATSVASTPTPWSTGSPNTPSLSYVSETASLGGSVYRSRDSTSGHSTASTAKAAGPRSPVVGNLTFRELDSSPRQAWTEQEKERMWDDMLESSARAGGTLHLGESGLASDNIRFSEYSEL